MCMAAISEQGPRTYDLAKGFAVLVLLGGCKVLIWRAGSEVQGKANRYTKVVSTYLVIKE